MPRLVWLPVVLLAVASIWFVQAPPRGADAYRDEAAKVSEALAGQVRGALIVVRAQRRGRILTTTAGVGLREAEEDAGATVGRFAAYNPPAGLERLRADVVAVGSDAHEALASLRIAADHGAWDEVALRAVGLNGVARRLDRLARRARA